MHILSHQKNWVRCHTKGENSKNIGTGITHVSKNRIRSTCISKVGMCEHYLNGIKIFSERELNVCQVYKYILQLFRYISYIPNNSYCGNAGGYYRTH